MIAREFYHPGVSTNLRSRVGDHGPLVLLTGVLSVASVALVFAAALGVIPASALPRSEAAVEAIPHLNAVISVLAVGIIGFGWRSIRNGQVKRHRVAMVSAFVLFVAFLVLYFYKVILEGPATFPGPDAVYRFVYLPLLAIHVLLAVVTLPLLYYVLLLATTRPVSALPDTPHPRVGRIAASLWITSFVLGIVVYAMLYLVYA